MKPARSLFVLAAAAVVTLAACGDNKGPVPPAPSTAGETTTSLHLLGCAAQFSDGALAPEGDTATCLDASGKVTIVVPVRLTYGTCNVVRNDYGWWTADDRVVTAEPEPDAETLAAACG